MHLLYCDETNLEERAGDFLIYGGLMIPAAQIKLLSDAIESLRQTYGVPRDFHLKFNPRPKNLSHGDFINLKRDILTQAYACKAKLLVYFCLHDIAQDPDAARRNGINTVCFHFDCILSRLGEPGLVLIDRFNDEGNAIEAHLREKFSVGLKDMPYSSSIRLTNIVGFHYSAIGQSHFPSVTDIVLGSLRFAINAHTRGDTQNIGTAQTLISLVSPLFWREEGQEVVPELGLFYSPKVVKVGRYREKYQSLKNFLEMSGLKTLQPITAERQY